MRWRVQYRRIFDSRFPEPWREWMGERYESLESARKVLKAERAEEASLQRRSGSVPYEFRIVRVLSHEEAKRKFAASVLREIVDDPRVWGLLGKRVMVRSASLRDKADELWPQKRKR